MSTPLVNKIFAILQDRINAGAYQDRFPSHRELVDEFEISRSVIRKVLENLTEANLIVQAPRCRTIVRPMALRPSIGKDTLRRSIGIWVWPGPSDPGMAELVQGIAKTLDGNAFRLVIDCAVWETWDSVCDSEARFLERMIEDRDIAGIILWCLGGEGRLPSLRAVRAAKIPIVFVDRRPPPGFDADYVGIDNEHGAEKVVRHLLSIGHRRIGHITNLDHASTVSERLAGYRRALERARIPFLPELVVTAGESSAEEAVTMHDHLLTQLMSLADPPTAIFAVNDLSAHRFMAALERRGMRIPEDMAVAGFDGSDRWVTGERFLTTVQQPFEVFGRRAVEILLARIDAEAPVSYRHVELDAPLSIHGSTRHSRRESSVQKGGGTVGTTVPST